MALYNEILAGRFNRGLQKMFGIKGPPPVPQLGGEVIPGVSLFYGAEARYLEDWNRLGGRVLSAAVAANNSAARLNNPSASGVVAVIERINFLVSAAAQVFLTVERKVVSVFGIVGSQIAFDARKASPAGTVDGSCLVQGKNNNATTFGVVAGAFSLNTPNLSNEIILTDIQEIPLLPGDAFEVTVQGVNIAIDCTFWWRERVLEDSEKT